jgi:hypothetical protein
MLQSLASSRPRKVMASFLPFRPWSFPDRRVFDRKAAGRLEFSTTGILSCTSMPPQRLSPLRSALLPASHADHGPLSSGTRKEASRPFSISGPRLPFFHRFIEPASDRLVPCPPEVPHTGFGYPLCGPEPSVLESLFQLSTLLGFPLQSFSPTRRSKRSFLCFLRSCALLRNSSRASYRRFSGFFPPGEPYPCSLPGLLRQVGAACSPGFLRPLRRFLRRTGSKASTFRAPPLVL